MYLFSPFQLDEEGLYMVNGDHRGFSIVAFRDDPVEDGGVLLLWGSQGDPGETTAM